MVCVLLVDWSQVTAARAVLAKADAEKAELEAEATRVRDYVAHLARAEVVRFLHTRTFCGGGQVWGLVLV